MGVGESKEPISKTYCNCSLGWITSLFSALLDKPIKAKLLEAIVSGGNVCRFIISLD
ncbi:MAG: hypothetical protein JXA99_17200 [Candidatus Lokiarchaeota archaeon]|nr:hypothetical protein [Candidatus Lokiarchaeota archaeon]